MPSLRHRSSALVATVNVGGVVAASILYGIGTVQSFTYFRRFSKTDSGVLKLLILFLWILDSVDLTFIVHAVYTYAITDFGNMLAELKPLWSITSHVVISSLSDIIVRSLFCQRIWKLSDKNILLTTAVGFTSIIVFASGIAFSAWGYLGHSYFVTDDWQLSVFLYTYFISGAVSDMLIATVLCLLLARKRSAFQRTNSLINILMMYSINTGVLTSCCAILCLSLYAALPSCDRYSFVAAMFMLPKLLLNSLLASLNARKRAIDETLPSCNLEADRSTDTQFMTTARTYLGRESAKSVRVTIERFTDSDICSSVHAASLCRQVPS